MYSQTDLLMRPVSANNNFIMNVLDNINRKHEKSTIHLAAEGFKKRGR